MGNIVQGKIIPSDANIMLCKWWMKIPEKFPDIILDEFVVMPNHFHAILVNTSSEGAPLSVCPDDDSRIIGNEGEHTGSPLHRVVQWFKTMTTNEYIRNVKTNGWQSFSGKLWQRNYYEHIIRNEWDYQRIKKYILENPINWNK